MSAYPTGDELAEPNWEDDEDRRQYYPADPNGLMQPGAAPQSPALTQPALPDAALPQQQPALALAPQGGPRGPSPTGALALQPQAGPGDGMHAAADAAAQALHEEQARMGTKWGRPMIDEDEDPDRVDAVSGPPGGGPPPAAPAVPGGQLTAEQLAAAATTPQNPNGDATDQYLAANPIQNGPAPKPPTIQEQEQTALAQQGPLTDQAVQAEQRKLAAQNKINEAEQVEAAAKQKIAEEHAQHQQKIVEQANQRTQEWLDRSHAEADKYAQMGLHDYWQDKGVFSKVLAGLAMFTGAAGGRSPADNPGMQIINQAIERDFRQQQFAIQKQRGNVEIANQGYETSLSAKQQALADNNLKKAGAYDAVAAQAVSMKLKQGVPMNQAMSDANVIALKQKANDTRLETLKAVHQQNLQDAQLGQGEEKIGISRQELLIKKQQADTQRLLAEARAHKLRGAGGGGGGGGFAPGVDAMQKAAEAEGASLASVIRAGLDAGMSKKDAAKEGKPIWDEYLKGPAEEHKAAQHALDKLESDFKIDMAANGVVAGQGGSKGLLPKNQALVRLLHAVDSNNPLAAKEAFLAFDQAARGGTATQGSIDELKKSLGGTYVQIKNWMEGKASGRLAPEAMRTFHKALATEINANVAAAADAKNSLGEKYFQPDYYGIKKHVEGQFAPFADFRDANGNQVFKLERDPNAPGIDRRTGRRLKQQPAGGGGGKIQLDTQETAILIQELNNNPKGPRATRIKKTLHDAAVPGY